VTPSKAFALTWYRALTWYCSPARPFAAPDVPLLVTKQHGSPSPAFRQLSRARNASAGSPSDESTKLKRYQVRANALLPPDCYLGVWPLQDIRFPLRLLCKNPSCFFYPPLHCPQYCNTIARLLHNMYDPTLNPLLMCAVHRTLLRFSNDPGRKIRHLSKPD